MVLLCVKITLALCPQQGLTQTSFETFKTSVFDIQLVPEFHSLVPAESHPRTFPSKQLLVTETALVLNVFPPLIKMPQPAKAMLLQIFN